MACPISTSCYSCQEYKICIVLVHLDIKHSEVSGTGKTPRTNHSDSLKKEGLCPLSSHWQTIFLRNLLSVPIASTGCHQSLEFGWGYSFVWASRNCVTLLRVAQDLKSSLVCCVPVLNTDPSSIWSIINVLKYPKLYYKSSLKYFGQVYRQLLKYFVVTLCILEAVFSGSNGTNKLTFWIYGRN
jgi:hypothetical protein